MANSTQNTNISAQNTNVRILRSAIWVLITATSISGYLAVSSLQEEKGSLEKDVLRFQNKLNEFNSIYNSKSIIDSHEPHQPNSGQNGEKKKRGTHSGQKPVVLPPPTKQGTINPIDPLPEKPIASVSAQSKIDSIFLKFIDIPNPYNHDYQALKNFKIKINGENISPVKIIATENGYSLCTTYPTNKLKNSNKIVILGTPPTSSTQSVNFKEISRLLFKDSEIMLAVNNLTSTVAINVKSATLSKR